MADLLVDSSMEGCRRVQELFVNEKHIKFEACALLNTITRHRKQMDQWLAATNDINSILKVSCNDTILVHTNSQFDMCTTKWSICIEYCPSEIVISKARKLTLDKQLITLPFL
jgi:hypothetical protein